MKKFFIRRALGTIALAEVVLGLGLVLYILGGGVTDAAYWWREAKVNEFERGDCQRRHAVLIKQIKKEGLWARLGMPGQPHLW